MNMVMNFVLHPLSHYNSITEPRARFFLSLLEHLTIDFPSHFILSPTPSCVVSLLSLYTCFLFICMQSIIPISHKDALMSFV